MNICKYVSGASISTFFCGKWKFWKICQYVTWSHKILDKVAGTFEEVCLGIQTSGFNTNNAANILLLSMELHAPPYIYELHDFYNPSCSGLRSTNKTLLVQPKSSWSWGDRAFSVVAPRIWNSLLNFIRSCSNPYSRNISSNLLMNWINLYYFMFYLSSWKLLFLNVLDYICLLFPFSCWYIYCLLCMRHEHLLRMCALYKCTYYHTTCHKSVENKVIFNTNIIFRGLKIKQFYKWCIILLFVISAFKNQQIIKKYLFQLCLGFWEQVT